MSFTSCPFSSPSHWRGSRVEQAAVWWGLNHDKTQPTRHLKPLQYFSLYGQDYTRNISSKWTEPNLVPEYIWPRKNNNYHFIHPGKLPLLMTSPGEQQNGSVFPLCFCLFQIWQAQMWPQISFWDIRNTNNDTTWVLVLLTRHRFVADKLWPHGSNSNR